ncbi:hypothetical protein WMF30_41450 [Sorangium sp. So ce134]
MPLQLKMSFPFEERRSPQAWDEAFVYLDEQHPNPDDNSFAVGLLMTPRPLPRAMIDDAMHALPMQSNAVKRGYFHAMIDGRDAQTALADAFGAHASAAEFHAFRWISAKEETREWSPNERHMHVASLVLCRACSIVRSAIHVEYAAGPTIKLEEFRAWMKEHDDVRLRTMILQGGAVPTRFPKLDVSESTPAASPGIQAVDLLLWHQRRLRARLKTKCRDLLKRAHLEEDMRWSQDDGPMESWMFTRDSPIHLVHRPGGRMVNEWNRWASLLIGIERVVHDAARLQPSPVHIAHLMPRVRTASTSLRGYLGADLDRLREFLRVFLILADTLPICDDDFEAQQTAADAIRVATSMDDLRLAECVSRLGWWVTFRRTNQTQLGWDG